MKKITIIISLILSLGIAYSQPCLNNWEYRVAVDIENTSALNLTNYQQLLLVNTQNLIAAGKLNADGSDFRFLDINGNPIDFWLNTNTLNSTQTKIWVKVDLVASNTEQIFMFYGNNNAISVSNGTNTFIHFDDFNGNSINSIYWTECGTGDITVSNGSAIFSTGVGGKSIIKRNSAWNPIALPIYSEMDVVATAGGTFLGQQKSNSEGYAFYYDGTQAYMSKTNSGESCFNNTTDNNFTTSSDNGIVSMRWSSQANQVIDGLGANGSTVYSDFSYGNIYSVIGNVDVAGTTEINWFRTRQYFSGTINYTFQVEEVIPSTQSAQIYTNSPICEGETLELSVDDITGATYSWSYPSFIGNPTGRTQSRSNAIPEYSGIYSVTITSTSSNCGNIISTTNVLVNPNTVSGTLTGDNQVCEDNNSGVVKLSGQTGDIVRWESSLTGNSPWSSIVNISDSLEYFNLTHDTYYRSIIKSGKCNSLISNPVYITVDKNSQGGILFGENEHCYGINSGSLILSQQEGDVLKWQSSYNNILWSDISNTSGSLSYSDLTDTIKYRAIVKSGVCENDTSTIAQIIINPLPVVDFINDTVSLGYETHFTNLSTIVNGNIQSYQWDFETGSGASVKNPIYQFAQADTFSVLLTAYSNKGCIDSIRKDVLVYDVPNIDFSFENDCANDTIFFINNTGFQGNVNYLWDFGDGIGTSGQTNPKYVYTTYGTYNVKLIVNSDNNLDSLIKVIEVYPRSLPDFSADNVCDGQQVSFFNNSSIPSGGLTYNWDFGDENTNTSVNPYHQYSTSGSYLVTLISTTNNNCADTVEKEVVIFEQPNAYFNFTSVCSGYSTLFNDSSSYTSGGLVDTSKILYSWGFGNGNTSQLVNPIYSYNVPGNYLVELEIVSDSGCASSYIRSVEAFPNPVAEFNVENGCFGFITNFNNTSSITSGNLQYEWDFNESNISSESNPSHLFQNPGSYDVGLIVISDNNCRDTIVNTVDIFENPVADFYSDAVCDGLPSEFINQTTVDTSVNIVLNSWDFGDGTNSIQENPVKQYLNPGNYNVSLIVKASNSCRDTIEKTIIVDYIPKANFTTENVCFNTEAEFLNASTIGNNSVLSYQWTFGDNQSSVLENPINNYSTPGTYMVKLKASSQNNCVDSLINYITIYELPIADAGADTSISLGYSILLDGDGGVNYFWTPFDELDDAYSKNTIAKPTSSTDFILEVQDENYCINYDTVNVEVVNDFTLVISNILTPDGNGENDTWYIGNIENYEDNEVYIFDRWGGEIYNEKGYKNSWNGVNNNGDIVTDGTYYYLIKSEAINKVYKGAITVLRNK